MKKLNNCSNFKPLAWLMIFIIAAFVAGCGDGGGDAVAPGTLGVFLTDAPACGFDAVNVTVSKVRAHHSISASDTEPGWVDITLNPARKINLLNLNNGVLDKLGETPLLAGHYTQLRLVLAQNTAAVPANSVVPSGGVETPLATPSAAQSGIKLVNEFDVASGQRTDLVLDFDACRSVVKRGNGSYGLKPVIKVVPFVLNGINGFVDTALLGNSVMVTAQQQGVIVQSTAPKAQSGEFFLTRLAPGNYDVVLTANGHATAVIATVPVASSTSVSILSNQVTPLTLPVSSTKTVSGNATLSPASADEVAYVTAKQTLGTALTVAVKFTAADDAMSGAYTLSLPVASPILGHYDSGALPIALVAQAGIAGRYAIEASAAGYQSQSASKDISLVDATQNFILMP